MIIYSTTQLGEEVSFTSDRKINHQLTTLGARKALHTEENKTTVWLFQDATGKLVAILKDIAPNGYLLLTSKAALEQYERLLTRARRLDNLH